MNNFIAQDCKVGTLSMAGSLIHEVPMKVNTGKMAKT